jgi:Tol biopolymer transport system component
VHLPGVRLPGAPWLPGVIGPTLSALGLMVVAALSYGLLTGQLPLVAGNGNGGPIRTPTPSNVVVVDPRANVPGTLVYVKDGNLWLQSGAAARQLTSGGNDATPTWSADGEWIYFIRTTSAPGRWPIEGVTRPYTLAIPSLVRIHPDGTGEETLFNGRIRSGGNTWAAFIRQPVPSPDGTRVALITDYPQPWNSDLVLKILNLGTGNLSNPGLADVFPLGHQDPAWSPDGSAILYVKDARAGTRGAPVIERYDLATKKVRALTGPGYLGPAWSPDGRYIAATQTGSFGTNVVILDARTGSELLRLTTDEVSFAPTWSPAGDAIAFLRVGGGVVDLELTTLRGSGPNWTIGQTIALTNNAGLDGPSRPSWFIPADELPTPAPTSEASAQPFPTLHASGTP